MNRMIALVLAAIVWTATASSAHAQATTYRIFGDAVGLIDGQVYSAPIVLMGVRQTDPAASVLGGARQDVRFSSVTVRIRGIDYTSFEPATASFLGNSLGFGVNSNYWWDNWIFVTSPALQGYNPVDESGVIAVDTGYVGMAFDTSRGNVVISRLSNAYFWATAGVPEPGTWALMLIGFGAIGFALRRRRVAVGSAMGQLGG